MADTSVSYKCPNCGGPLAYAPGKGKEIKCEYCETTFKVEALDKVFAQSREMAAAAEEQEKQKWTPGEAGNSWSAEEQAMMRTMTCSSCGAEIVCDENTMATECCYCGNPTMIPGRFAGMLKPDYVIPFSKSKEEAVAAMKEFYKGKRLLPNNYASTSRLEKIQGMYVPFWLFDAEVEGSASFSATQSRSWDEGDDTITETDHYRCIRQGGMDFRRVPADGSRKMDDTYMQSIEPYDYKEMAEFNTVYMAGYLADKYDVPAEECVTVADSRIQCSTLDTLEETVTGYATVSRDEGSVVKKSSRVSYAMAPVWILSSKYKDEVYTFMMNGQTGKIVGRLPVDTGKGFMYGAAAAMLTLPLTYYMFKVLLALIFD
ncbi:hypothetical protein [Anaerovibrio sp.]|uniref:hypothetical protein n=1 Tax=Anaerovibrio sp. TaxID=1872532 RepID=UPI003F14BC62